MIFCVGLQDYSILCDPADLDLCWKHAYEKPHTNSSTEFVNLANILMEEENLIVPAAKQVLLLYFSLTDLIENML